MTAIDLLALVGPRAAGKSTLARALAPRLGWPVLDTDELLAVRVGCSAGDYLAQAGEVAFRREEEAICLEVLAPGEPRIVALGGGAVLSAAVRARLARPGAFVVFAEAPVASLLHRQQASPVARPPLTSMSPEQEVSEVLRARRPFYSQVSHFTVDTNSSIVDTCVALILAKMGLTP